MNPRNQIRSAIPNSQEEAHSPMWRSFAVSASASLAACPPTIRALNRRGVLDLPNHRSSHSTPTPRGGGIAVGAGIAAAILAERGPRSIWRTFSGPFALATIGLVDDRQGLSPKLRLAAQALIGTWMGWSCVGTRSGALLGTALTPPLVNATNFMDGVNGISALTAATWGAALLSTGGPTHAPSVLLGTVTAGSFLGFLPFNAPNAQLFLGDAGSYLLGGLFTAGALTSETAGAGLVTLAPVSVYLADTSVTLVKRTAKGEPLTEAHRDHTYQRLVDNHGLTHLQVSSLVALTAGLVSLAARQSSTFPLIPILLATYVALPEVLNLMSPAPPSSTKAKTSQHHRRK